MIEFPFFFLIPRPGSITELIFPNNLISSLIHLYLIRRNSLILYIFFLIEYRAYFSTDTAFYRGSEYYLSFTRVLPEHYQSSIWVLPECYLSFISVLSEYYLSIIWVLSEYILLWTLFDHFLSNHLRFYQIMYLFVIWTLIYLVFYISY